MAAPGVKPASPAGLHTFSHQQPISPNTCCSCGAGLVNLWIQDIRSIRDKHADTLRSLQGKEQVDRLVEYNVVRQVST